MGCDLDVDTDGLRRVAAQLQRASTDFAGRPIAQPPAAPPEHAAGSTAAGREALRAALSRSQQAVQAAGMLAALAEDLAGRVTAAAVRFEDAEELCRGGR
jgi:hypothetical protein